MDEVDASYVELPDPAFPDLVANQTRTFRCSCGDTVSVDLLINMKREMQGVFTSPRPRVTVDQSIQGRAPGNLFGS
jgi:hypothetical protein